MLNTASLHRYMMIGGWPVQFLPTSPGLLDEALNAAREFDVEGTRARVFGPMYLAAIALQTGGAEDKLRVVQFREAGLFDVPEFEAILSRHTLLDTWRKFEQPFPAETS